MTFSRRQQQVLLVFYVVYGIWLLWFHCAQRDRTAIRAALESPTPPAQVVYIDPPIAINSADARELQLLPGIGPVLARRIIAYRRQHGSFQTLESLGAIQRIGPKTLRTLRYYLIFDE